jgi:hypothetical protein
MYSWPLLGISRIIGADQKDNSEIRVENLQYLD